MRAAKRVYVYGKALMLSDPGEFLGVYDGLGQLIASASTDREIPVTDEVTVDALGNPLVRNSNRIYQVDYNESLDSAYYMGHRLTERTGTWYPHGRTAPASAPSVAVADSLGIEYDNSGNVTFQQNIRRRAWTTVIGPPIQFETARDSIGHVWNWSYYDSAERLRYAQRTRHAISSINQTIFDEYWYDALGRRVLVRTRVDSTAQCPSTEVTTTPIRCQQQLLKTVWDGDHVLLEQRTRGGWQRGDQNTETDFGGSSDWWGKVRYTQTGAIDAPLLVWKGVGGSNPSNPRILHRNWRGNVAGATFALTGNIDSTTVWPAALTDVWLAPDANQTLPDPTRWLGSLTTDQKDATGTLYRRNRYYDPVTGRFTQEDPIGLAGG
jgi:RHS repeat-associated protein